MIYPQPRKDRSQPYKLQEADLVGPPLPGEVIVAATVDELIDHLAAEIVVQAKFSVRQHGDFQLALSGGSTPLPLYERLMYDPDCRSLPWAQTHLWLVDERCVPPEDERSNFRMIRETIVDHSGIPADHVHAMAAMAETADADYESELREVLGRRGPTEDRLDFVLLGMGEDGHTASLFPFCEVIGETERLVCCMTAPREADPPQRVTMTYPLINAARVVAVLVTGSHKAAAIQRVVAGQESREALPISGVRPAHGELKWYLDAEACGLKVST